jgi:hypothetical protein
MTKPTLYVLRSHTTTIYETRILTQNRRIDQNRMISRTACGRRWSIRVGRNCLAGWNSWREWLMKKHVCNGKKINYLLRSEKKWIFPEPRRFVIRRKKCCKGLQTNSVLNTYTLCYLNSIHTKIVVKTKWQ